MAFPGLGVTFCGASSMRTAAGSAAATSAGRCVEGPTPSVVRHVFGTKEDRKSSLPWLQKRADAAGGAVASMQMLTKTQRSHGSRSRQMLQAAQQGVLVDVWTGLQPAGNYTPSLLWDTVGFPPLSMLLGPCILAVVLGYCSCHLHLQPALSEISLRRLRWGGLAVVQQFWTLSAACSSRQLGTGSCTSECLPLDRASTRSLKE